MSEQKNGNKFDSFHLIPFIGREDLIKILLEKGADVSIGDNNKLLPVDVAQQKGIYPDTEANLPFEFLSSKI